MNHRARKAIDLRLNGATWRHVGDELGYGEYAARKQVMQAARHDPALTARLKVRMPPVRQASCAYCGEPFATANPRRIYCGPPCKQRAWRGEPRRFLLVADRRRRGRELRRAGWTWRQVAHELGYANPESARVSVTTEAA